ncbi:hypothetical protein K469DRAFT_753069 [Zopfia rhizophila CBS 207.26]|uniref:Uncharacterized protein n=1 Tax=Zopfia rhizophila CBS 207.26 TaxID=1314779 RepID=A0A6A6DTJ9_9PEZI|nr:hypothetical protein K469DRAFT_753069 [Zopfia rhizophila CBS 207.26]
MMLLTHVLTVASLASVGFAQLIKLRISATNEPTLNNKYLSSNGTHVGFFTDGSPSSATVFNATPSAGDRHWTLQIAGTNDHFGAVVGPSNRNLLTFQDLVNPGLITPPDGTLIEWNIWRLFPASDPRVRVADMSANQWITISSTTVHTWDANSPRPANSSEIFDIHWENA